ncbi:DHA2 family efflux MFS transporter permease subunit [Streptomyces sp. SL13]|uniref:DHA2 family efflux MFS transporter permease subunit n=1 Tax=Streptantibioticus silvisoli TaxID=2705255 RepID=A0AA90K7P6_9ACTN|nr:DHA2 family efflux MFS transporter permease subunit [Streptantibioticus silvisoli]MDI5969133.1 DHA2 family efflux MFS transporter permease subunit [Streptantibioticus silvisoli]
MSVFIAGVDATIINVALPAIQRGMHASVSGLQWTIDAYTLVIACLLMLSGSLADRFGRRRAFQTGLALFSIGSLLCSVAPGLGWLVGFRAVQAVGGSLLNPVAMSIVVNTFTDRRERARAVGVWGSVAGLSLAAGPVLGGLLVSGLGWRSIFWINVPIGIAAIVLTQRFVPESKAARARRLDPFGQVLVVVLLASITAAIIEGPRRGWGSASIVTLFVVAALGAGALVVVETRRRDPLIDMRFFRSAPFSGAMLIAVAAFATLGGFLFLNTLYLQDVRGESALGAGVRTIPMAVVMAVFATVSGRLVAARGPRLPLVLAGPLLAVGALLFLRLDARTPLWFLVVAYVVFGAGSGLVTAPITNTAVSGMPADQAGVAGALASTSRQFGSAVGVAVTGAIIAAGTGAGFVTASHAAWAVIAGCGVAVLLGGLASTSRWARQTARRNGERLAAARTREVTHADSGNTVR